MLVSAAADNDIIGIDATCASVNAYDLVVTDIMVVVGEAVEAEQILMILEYNKVVTEVTSPNPEFVVAIHSQLGDEVQVGERLVETRPL